MSSMSEGHGHEAQGDNMQDARNADAHSLGDNNSDDGNGSGDEVDLAPESEAHPVSRVADDGAESIISSQGPSLRGSPAFGDTASQRHGGSAGTPPPVRDLVQDLGKSVGSPYAPESIPDDTPSVAVRSSCDIVRNTDDLGLLFFFPAKQRASCARSVEFESFFSASIRFEISISYVSVYLERAVVFSI